MLLQTWNKNKQKNPPLGTWYSTSASSWDEIMIANVPWDPCPGSVLSMNCFIWSSKQPWKETPIIVSIQ